MRMQYHFPDVILPIIPGKLRHGRRVHTFTVSGTYVWLTQSDRCGGGNPVTLDVTTRSPYDPTRSNTWRITNPDGIYLSERTAS